MDIINPSSGLVMGSIPVAGAIKIQPTLVVGCIFISFARRTHSANEVRRDWGLPLALMLAIIVPPLILEYQVLLVWQDAATAVCETLLRPSPWEACQTEQIPVVCIPLSEFFKVGLNCC